MEERKLKKFLSIVVSLLLVIMLIPSMAFAETSIASAEDLWTLMGDTELVYNFTTFKAKLDEHDGSKTFETVQDGNGAYYDISGFEFSKAGDKYVLTYDVTEEEKLLGIDLYTEDAVTMTFTVLGDKITEVELAGTEQEIDTEDYWYYSNVDGVYKEADGSFDYAWNVSKDEYSSVWAYSEEGFFTITGYGDMKDFASPADRPWDSIAKDAIMVNIDDAFDSIGITGIGDYAFYNFGQNADSIGVYGGGALQTIGAHAFEGVNFEESIYVDIPENVSVIGEYAFKGLGNKLTFEFDELFTPEIADNAFEGTTAKVYTVFNAWDNSAKKNYGGNLTYEEKYLVEAADLYDGYEEEFGGNMRTYIYLDDVYPVTIETEPDEYMEEEYGYTFKGWSTGAIEGEDYEIVGSLDDTSFEIIPKNNLTFTALYETDGRENPIDDDNPDVQEQDVPKTGDNSGLYLFLTLAIGAMLTALYAKRKVER